MIIQELFWQIPWISSGSGSNFTKERKLGYPEWRHGHVINYAATANDTNLQEKSFEALAGSILINVKELKSALVLASAFWGHSSHIWTRLNVYKHMCP